MALKLIVRENKCTQLLNTCGSPIKINNELILNRAIRQKYKIYNNNFKTITILPLSLRSNRVKQNNKINNYLYCERDVPFHINIHITTCSF